MRVDLSGEGGEQLLRRRAEALDALQHIVNTGFRRHLAGDRSFVVDCMDYRKAKDEEPVQMARFMMERAKSSGAPQEVGPLKSYARRLGHLASKRTNSCRTRAWGLISQDGDQSRAALIRISAAASTTTGRIWP